jgi:thioredoxin 1
MRIVTATFLALGMVVGIAAQETPSQGGGAATNVPAKVKLPRLVDLGADKCIPCKLMAPILSELKLEQAGCLEVEFVDVWKSPEAAKPYKISLIPTQIFYDANGKELFRHEGFYSKGDILSKWKELGVKLKDAK